GAGPLAGPVLSHDQLEAVLMRAGGHEVRVLPVEDGSLEQNPPTLPDFIARDLRWCQGNMQYLKLLRLPGLRPLGRLQLALAIMLFLASPLWLGFLSLGLGQALLGDGALVARLDPAVGIALFVVMMTMAFAPKLIGIAEAMVSRRRSRAYGGRVRLLAGALVETVFSMLLGPIMAVAHSVFIGGLLFGQRIRWRAQARTGRRITALEAIQAFWPQTALGLGTALLLALHSPALLPWAAPVLAGLIFAVPFACITSSARLGRWLVRSGLCATPEELALNQSEQPRPGTSVVGAVPLGPAVENPAS
ncbi:MAG: glucans biosynthesis glucosyltransferase MdoH, partial [Geminicoccaceae bacterium]|nr:glucans biosynthesis glucosyltransferase MdoH [Geminicoccaceae bacterium]